MLPSGTAAEHGVIQFFNRKFNRTPEIGFVPKLCESKTSSTSLIELHNLHLHPTPLCPVGNTNFIHINFI